MVFGFQYAGAGIRMNRPHPALWIVAIKPLDVIPMPPLRFVWLPAHAFHKTIRKAAIKRITKNCVALF